MRILARRNLKQKIVLLAACLVFGGLGLGSLAVAPQVFARAMDCDSNAIIKCGFGSNQEFVDIVKSNDSRNGHRDLQAVFGYFGFDSSDYSRFVSSAKDGLFHRDGRVTVGAQTIINTGRSLGRNYFSGSSSKVINGVTYYYGDPNLRFAAGVESIPVKVMFDGNGNAEFVVQTPCGNPMWGTNVISSATCDSINKTDVAGQANTYDFTASAHAAGNAALTQYIYDFGDGSPQVVKTSPTDPARHTYTKVGDSVVTLTVVASAPGGNTIRATAQTCKKTITVLPPPAPKVTITKVVNGKSAIVTDTGKNFVYQLKVANAGNVPLANVAVSDEAPRGIQFISTDKGSVTGNKLAYTIPSLGLKESVTINITAKATIYTPKAIVNKACVDTPTVPGAPDACDTADVTVNPPLCSKLDGPNPNGLTYTFVATGSYGEGVTLISGDFDFGDGKAVSGVAAAGSTVTTSHTYAVSGEYSAIATLHFISDGVSYTAPTCRASVKPQAPPTPECKPGIPVGDIRCNPCQYDASIPASDARCVAPAATLPNTGAGNVIALASAALVGGFLWYRHVLFQRHKRAYLQADFGTSPLPLAEPLESPDPLAATPLAPQAHRRGFRRKRQF